MKNMEVLIWLTVIYAVFGVCVQGSKWGIWQDITKCDAMPCRCHDENDRCTKSIYAGKLVQMRVCKFDGSTGCKMDKDGGALRISRGCRNEKICPGWSEWIEEECDCDKKTMKVVRYCDNPPPIHKSVICERTDNGKAITEDKIENCECEEAVEMTTESTESVTEEIPIILPCCNGSDSSDYDFANEDQSKSSTPSTTTAKFMDMYGLYGDGEDINSFEEEATCRECNATDEYDDTSVAPDIVGDDDNNGGEEGDVEEDKGNEDEEDEEGNNGNEEEEGEGLAVTTEINDIVTDGND